jgi:hypothetical protein
VVEGKEEGRRRKVGIERIEIDDNTHHLARNRIEKTVRGSTRWKE